MLRKLRPIVVYSDAFLVRASLFMPASGMSLFPFVILKEKYRDGDDFWKEKGKKTINHESIHFQQQLEMGVIPFYIWYVLEWLIKLPFLGEKAYENISFEREAYDNDDNLNYLEDRKRYNWIFRIFK